MSCPRGVMQAPNLVKPGTRLGRSNAGLPPFNSTSGTNCRCKISKANDFATSPESYERLMLLSHLSTSSALRAELKEVSDAGRVTFTLLLCCKKGSGRLRKQVAHLAAKYNYLARPSADSHNRAGKMKP